MHYFYRYVYREKSTGKIEIPKHRQISFDLELAINSDIIYLFAYGAGAGYHHEWFTDMSSYLVKNGISVMRFNLPFMENGRRPGSPKKDIQAIGIVFNYIESKFTDAKIITGGKSYGGRMTSLASAEGLISDSNGMVFFGFPLHRSGTTSIERVEHFKVIKKIMLFLQGRKAALANLNYLIPELEKVNADYYIEEYGDHSLKVPKRSGKDQNEVYEKIANKAANWMLSKV